MYTIDQQHLRCVNPRTDLSSTDLSSMTEVLSITEVERQTGIRQATLRMWEKRYGFPQPLRDQYGDRVYPLSQVERLQAARRLLDQGVRPGRIFSGSVAPGEAAPAGHAGPSPTAQYSDIFVLLHEYRLAELHSHFQYRLLDLGLRRFAIEFLAPLSTAVGSGWAQGELPVRSGHLYAQLAASVLHAQLATVRTAAGGRRPKALLATLTGEAHALGILMVEAVLATLEAECIQLGSDVPIPEVAGAARDTAADIVALSFSSYFPLKSAVLGVRALRASLPPATRLWVGGDGAPGAARLGPGVEVFASLEAIEPALTRWRARRASQA
jgi:methylmalonyl-CoA mutase cobalamin-binding subunit